jgi:hypothetical protein
LILIIRLLFNYYKGIYFLKVLNNCNFVFTKASLSIPAHLIHDEVYLKIFVILREVR